MQNKDRQTFVNEGCRRYRVAPYTSTPICLVYPGTSIRSLYVTLPSGVYFLLLLFISIIEYKSFRAIMPGDTSRFSPTCPFAAASPYFFSSVPLASTSTSIPALYAELDVSPSISAVELSKQYKRLSLLYHPDRFAHRTAANGGECDLSNDALLEKYQAITAAYKVLSDPKKRAQYDAQHAVNFGSRAQAVKEVISKYSSTKGASSLSPSSSCVEHPTLDMGKTEDEETKKEKLQPELLQNRSHNKRMREPSISELADCLHGRKDTNDTENEEEDEEEEYNPTEVKAAPSLPP